MKSGKRIVAGVILIFLLGTGIAAAVGYERYSLNGPPKTGKIVKSRGCVDLEDSLRKATFIDKYPALLDQTSALVKDILSQFGIVQKKAP